MTLQWIFCKKFIFYLFGIKTFFSIVLGMAKVLIASGGAKGGDNQTEDINVSEVLDISKPNMVVYIFKIIFLS